MSAEDNSEVGFELRGGKVSLGCPSSGINTDLTTGKVSSMAMPDRLDPFSTTGWDQFVSLNQKGSYSTSSSISPHAFANSHFLENDPMSSFPHLIHYQSNSSLVDMVPKVPRFGGESISEMVSSFGLPGNGQSTERGSFNTNHNQTKGIVTEKDLKSCAVPHGASPNQGEGISEVSSNTKRRRALESRSQTSAAENLEEQQERAAECLKEQEDKKRKTEQNVGDKQMGKQAIDDTSNGEPSKDNYVHMRAKRGQATNSHSLAERVRRERISERMRLLQELVPGCNKITGKAVMLDEIINYVQSLQQQVEFLSMKLATVNPGVNIDIDRILPKDMLHAQSSNATILGLAPGFSSSHPFPGIPQGSFPGISSAMASFDLVPQNLWDNNLQNVLQMGFDPDPSIHSLGTDAGQSKLQR